MARALVNSTGTAYPEETTAPSALRARSESHEEIPITFVKLGGKPEPIPHRAIVRSTLRARLCDVPPDIAITLERPDGTLVIPYLPYPQAAIGTTERLASALLVLLD